MSTLQEIEAAIASLPETEFAELLVWLDEFRDSQVGHEDVAAWLREAAGAATSGLSTDEILSITRGEE